MDSGGLARLRDAGFRLPHDIALADVTAELAERLGSTDPAEREEIAVPMLQAWIRRGVYDDLLPGLGDGMAAGLRNGLGQRETDTVFRRTASARVLAECIARDTRRPLVTPALVLDWGDRLATWLLRERDLRGDVPGAGRADAIGHGADALGVLSSSPHCGRAELAVILDVIADRITTPTDGVWVAGEHDRLARATLLTLHRDKVPPADVETWLNGLASVARPGRLGDPVVRRNAAAFLRALYLQLAIGPVAPPSRADLLLLLVDQLRQAHPGVLGSPGRRVKRG